ncbi:MAG: hypothetical protein BGO29_10920 [Bacteroidales bacterium 36-12]|nr:MAG: hypothetical protein BGO29_10920 [Bacteroidales bacterium 36-12]
MTDYLSRKHILSKIKAIKQFYILVLPFVLFLSCSQNTNYTQYKIIDPIGWSMDSICVFLVDIKDSSPYDLVINVRHTANYPYQNLWLFTEHISPDNSSVLDTIACVLADNAGKWLGSGSASIYDLPIIWKKDYKFATSGIQEIKIRHGMREEYLCGIQAIGLKVNYQNGKE